MTANEVLKLIDAGFTKEEILKLDVKGVPTETSATGTQVEAKSAETSATGTQAEAKSAATSEVKKEPATQTSGVTLSDDQFTKLLQQLNVKGASLDVPPETDFKSKLAEHFKEVTIGK